MNSGHLRAIQRALLSVSNKAGLAAFAQTLAAAGVQLISTGGTARAVVDLVERLGGTVAGLAFVVELNFLKGRERFEGYKVSSLLQYDE